MRWNELLQKDDLVRYLTFFEKKENIKLQKIIILLDHRRMRFAHLNDNVTHMIGQMTFCRLINMVQIDWSAEFNDN